MERNFSKHEASKSKLASLTAELPSHKNHKVVLINSPHYDADMPRNIFTQRKSKTMKAKTDAKVNKPAEAKTEKVCICRKKCMTISYRIHGNPDGDGYVVESRMLSAKEKDVDACSGVRKNENRKRQRFLQGHTSLTVADEGGFHFESKTGEVSAEDDEKHP